MPTIVKTLSVRIRDKHARSRKQFKKQKLRWRCSGGAKRALGWVPFKTASVKIVAGQVRFCGHHFKLWDSYGLAGYDLKTGSFTEDARGRWYFNATVDVETQPNDATASVGIDLGLKAVATCSDEKKLDRTRYIEKWAEKLAVAQRAGKKKSRQSDSRSHSQPAQGCVA
jgi:transposase